MLVSLLNVVPAFGKDHIVDKGFYSDPTGRLGIVQVQDEPFRPVQGMLSEGYTNSSLWLRLTIEPALKPLYLVIRPSFLDELTLYSPAGDGTNAWIAQFAGDQLPVPDSPLVRDSHLFEINPKTTTTYYLKLRTSSAAMLDAQALTFSEWYTKSLHNQAYQTLFIGLMLAILLWSTIDFILRREALVGWFMAAQAMQILFSLALMGYLVVFLPRWTNTDMLTSLIIQGTVVVTMLFHRMLVRPFRPSRWALILLDLLIGLAILEILLILSGYPRHGLKLGTVNLIIFIPTLLWLGYSTKTDALPGRIALRIAYNALAVALTVVIMPLLGFSHSIEFYLNALTTQSLVSACIMGIFLYKRSSAMAQRLIADRIKLERVEQGLNDHKGKIEEQRRFMDMLSHELKTPISVIQITIDTLTLPERQRHRLEKALSTMSEVIDRCRLSSQIDEQRLSVEKMPFDYGELVEEAADASLTPGRIDLYVEPIMIESDRQLLTVVLHNLMDNALKYSPADSQVKVELGAEKDRFVKGITLTVTNRYLGTKPPDSNIIFEKYVRGPTSTGLSGSGLGLHLCKQLVEMLGGSLVCQVLGPEIVFTLWFPEAAEPIGQDRSAGPASSGVL